MRLIIGVLAAAMLAAWVQPAWAVCVNRGGARNCQEFRDWESGTPGPAIEAAAADPVQSLKTIVMQPESLSGNAWVMTPTNGAGAASAGVVEVAVPACSLGVDCQP